MILSHGDDSGIPVPAVFMFVPGMPVELDPRSSATEVTAW